MVNKFRVFENLTLNYNRYAVAAKEICQKIYTGFAHCFYAERGSISYTVTVHRQYSADLPQGGVEIPCLLLFKAQPNKIQKVKSLLANK